MKRRNVIKNLAGLSLLGPMLGSPAIAGASKDDQSPILVVLELSGGNDGLNTVVPYADDNYYRLRPTIGIPQSQLLALDDHFGFNPGLQGIQKLWQNDELALIHGCGYDDPTFSHFNAMAYWHTGAPHQGKNMAGWAGRRIKWCASVVRICSLMLVALSRSR